jgi:hypothetical protein
LRSVSADIVEGKGWEEEEEEEKDGKGEIEKSAKGQVKCKPNLHHEIINANLNYIFDSAYFALHSFLMHVEATLPVDVETRARERSVHCNSHCAAPWLILVRKRGKGRKREVGKKWSWIHTERRYKRRGRDRRGREREERERVRERERERRERAKRENTQKESVQTKRENREREREGERDNRENKER